MIVFLRSNHAQKGIHRFLEGFTVFKECKIILIDDIRDSNKYEDEVGIFGGFLPKDLTWNTSIKRKYYCFCSPLGQTDLSSLEFISPQLLILKDCLDLIKMNLIENVVTPSFSLAKRFEFVYVKPIRINFDPEKYPITFDRKNYGFLGNNFRKHKNTLNQIAAISKLKPKEKIVVSNAKHYNAAFRDIFDCDFIEKDLSSDEDYYKEIRTHRLCFQCSFSEAFDYQALEYALVGVPIIASSCVEWLEFVYKGVLVVKNIDDYYQIWDKARYLIEMDGGQIYKDLCYKLRKTAINMCMSDQAHEEVIKKLKEL